MLQVVLKGAIFPGNHKFIFYSKVKPDWKMIRRFNNVSCFQAFDEWLTRLFLISAGNRSISVVFLRLCCCTLFFQGWWLCRSFWDVCCVWGFSSFSCSKGSCEHGCCWGFCCCCSKFWTLMQMWYIASMMELCFSITTFKHSFRLWKSAISSATCKWWKTHQHASRKTLSSTLSYQLFCLQRSDNIEQVPHCEIMVAYLFVGMNVDLLLPLQLLLRCIKLTTQVHQILWKFLIFRGNLFEFFILRN